MKIMKMYYIGFILLLQSQIYGQYEEILCLPCVQNFIKSYDPCGALTLRVNSNVGLIYAFYQCGDNGNTIPVIVCFDYINCAAFQGDCENYNFDIIFVGNSWDLPNCPHTNFTFFSNAVTNHGGCFSHPIRENYNLGDNVVLYTWVRVNQPLSFNFQMKVHKPDGNVIPFYYPIAQPISLLVNQCGDYTEYYTPDIPGKYTVTTSVVYWNGGTHQYASFEFNVTQLGPTIPTFTDVTPPSFNSITAYDAQIGDIDNDGKMDIIFHKLLAKNNSAPNTISFTISPYPSGSDDGRGSLLDFNNDGLLDFLQDYAELVDFNNDGIMSILKGIEYTNVTGSSFEPPNCILSDITGNCIIDNPDYYSSAIHTDINNDRVYDLLIDDKIYTNVQSSFDQIRSLPFTVWGSKAFDINNDGKTDIINGRIGSPLQIMLNNDNTSTVGVFQWPQIHVGDINNDGQLDILNNGVYFKNGDQMTFTFNNSFPEISNTANLFKPIDYDSDGDLDLLVLRNGLSPRLFRNNSSIINIRPAPPANPVSTVIDNEVNFSWTKSIDDLTQFPTYNLYVYNKDSNKPLLLPSVDLNTGVQRKLQKGNTEYNNGWKLKNLPPGRYGWKVQAVDQGFLGSTWSAEREFVIEAPVCDTEVEIIQNTPDCKAVRVIATGEILKVCGIANGLPSLPAVGFTAKIAYYMDNGCPIDSFCYAAYNKVNIVCIEPIADVQFILPSKSVNFLDTFSIPVIVSGFQDLLGFQFPVTWDTTKLEYIEVHSINNKLPNFSSGVNKPPNRPMVMCAYVHPDLLILNLPQPDTLFFIQFRALRNVCDSSFVSVQDSIPGINGPIRIEILSPQQQELSFSITNSNVKQNAHLCNNCTHPDYAPLMALYNSTNGLGWTNNTGWKEGAAGTSCDPCNFNGQPWYGLSCTNNRVTGLFLNANKLKGKIPENLDSLSKLERISLFSNNLIGSIPKNIGNLFNLTELILSYNELDGTIPSDIGKLTNLNELQLNDNQLFGTIPLEFMKLTNLKRLWLNNNNLSGSVPSELGSLINLQNLQLSSNQLSGTVPLSFGNLSNLITLELDKNNLSGNIPNVLGNLTNLIILLLDSNQLSGCFPNWVCNIPYFTSFDNEMLPWMGDYTPFCSGTSQTWVACNDGNSNTVNDRIQPDCSCRGEADCPDAKISFPSDTITLCLTPSLSPIPLPFSITGNIPGEASTAIWSGTSSGINNAVSPATFNPQLAGPGTHRLILTYQQRSCVWTDTMYVVLKPTPAASFTSADKLCISNPLNVAYTGTTTSGRTLIWDNDGAVRTDISSTAFNFVWATPGIKTLSLTVDLNGCTSDIFSRTIEVEPVPALPVLTCQESLGEVSFFWTAIPCASMYEVFINGISRGTQSQRSIVVSGLAEGETVTCRIQPISTCACPIPSVELSCTSRVCPLVIITLTPASDSICLTPSAATINLTAVLSGNSGTGSGSWTGPGTDQNGVFNPQTAGIGVHNITFRYEDSGCAFSKMATITVFPFKKAGIGSGVEYIQGSSQTVNLFNLLSGADPGGTWSYQIASLAGFSSASGTFDLTNNKPGTYTFTYFQTSPANICDDSSRATVVIVPIEPCEFTVNDDFLSAASGSLYKLNLLGNDEIIQDSFVFTILSYDRKNISMLSSEADGNVSLSVEGSFYDTLLVTYEVCTADCEECKQAVLKITNESLKNIIQTNIITPTIPGDNATLRFSDDDILESSELYIFNRNGDRIFHMKDYDNSWNADGYPGGIYYYVLRYKGVDIKKTLTVMK